MIEMNEGARQANAKMHQRTLEVSNKSTNKKLDRAIELLEMIIDAQLKRVADQFHPEQEMKNLAFDVLEQAKKESAKATQRRDCGHVDITWLGKCPVCHPPSAQGKGEKT